MKDSTFPSVPHLFEVVFKFSASDRRSMEDFTKVYSLDFDTKFNGTGPTNGMEEVIEFLSHCSNLKTLGIQQIQDLTPNHIQSIFETITGLEELELNSYGSTWNRSVSIKEILQSIKTHGKNLKKLILFSDRGEDAEKKILQEEIKIFNNSNIRAFLMKSRSTDLNDFSREKVFCVWKK